MVLGAEWSRVSIKHHQQHPSPFCYPPHFHLYSFSSAKLCLPSSFSPFSVLSVFLHAIYLFFWKPLLCLCCFRQKLWRQTNECNIILRDSNFKVSLCLEQLTRQRPEGTMQGETSWGARNREGMEASLVKDIREGCVKNKAEHVRLCKGE